MNVSLGQTEGLAIFPILLKIVSSYPFYFSHPRIGSIFA